MIPVVSTSSVTGLILIMNVYTRGPAIAIIDYSIAWHMHFIDVVLSFIMTHHHIMMRYLRFA